MSAQLVEGFDGGTFPPPGWARFDNGVGTNFQWERSTTFPLSGTGSAYINYECGLSATSEDWLVTPLVSITSADNLMSWSHFQPDPSDYNSLYIIRVSTTSQTMPAAFTAIDTIFEADVPNSGYELITFDLSAFVGQDIYVAIVHEQSCGDDYYLDNFQILGNCAPPDDQAIFTNITQTSVDVGWNGATNPLQVGISQFGSAPVPVNATASTPTIPITGLNPGEIYDVFLRSECEGSVPLMISGVFDGPLGGQPKGVELYVIDSIADLSDFGISSANNGSGTTAPTPEFVFPAVSALPGEYIYLTADSLDFLAYFGFSPDYETNVVNINGDDAVELFQDSLVIDLYGDPDTDGTGTAWDFLDGWAYRNPNTAPNGGSFDTLNWTFSGINVLDGCSTNGACGSQVPLGTFTSNGFSYSPWVGPFTFNTTCPVPLAGDNDSSAIPVTSPSFSDMGSTEACYTNTIGNAGPDIWYQVILDPCADSLVVSLCGSQFDTYVGLYDTGFTLITDNDDDGPICSGLQSSFIAGVNGGDTVYVVAEGFGSEVGVYNITIDQMIGMPPMPVVAYPVDSVCAGSPVILPTVSMMGGVFTSNSATLVLNDTTGELNPTIPGGYEVYYTIADGACEGTDTADVEVLAVDDPFFAYAGDTICDSLGTILPITVATAGGTFSISGGGVIDSLTGAIDLANTPPNAAYMITYGTDGTCPASLTSNVYVQECLVGIEGGLADQFTLYPNPTQGRFQILSEGLDMVAEIEVLDLVGKVIYREATEFYQGQPHLVELPDLTDGSYLVRLRGEQGYAVFKLNVQR